MTAVSTAATSSRMGRHLKLGAAALMTGLMLAACSTTDGADKTPPTQTPPPQVKVTPPPQDGPARDTTGFLKPRHLSVAEHTEWAT